MIEPLRVCVLGCGRVSKSHLAVMLEIPDKVEIAAIVSSDAEKRKSFQAEFSVPKAYETLQEALRDQSIEAVDICIPNHVHKCIDYYTIQIEYNSEYFWHTKESSSTRDNRKY